MFTLFFTKENVVDYATAKTSDTKQFSVYFARMIAEGFYLPPSQFEAAFISSVHTTSDIRKTVDAMRRALEIRSLHEST